MTESDISDDSKTLSQGKMMQVLEWAYDQAVDGVPYLNSAEELASSYSEYDGTITDRANALIRWQVAKACTSGALSGVGGLVFMPVTLPANITSVLFIQVRMIAAIAHMGGYNLKDDRVRTLVFACLVGNAAKDVFKEAGIAFGNKMGMALVRQVPGKVLVAINRKIGFRLVTKFGEKGVVNLGRMVPLAGAVIGGSTDSISTKLVGNTARNTFITDRLE